MCAESDVNLAKRKSGRGGVTDKLLNEFSLLIISMKILHLVVLIYLVVNIEPLGMMVHFLSLQSYSRHEPKGLRENDTICVKRFLCFTCSTYVVLSLPMRVQ